MDGVRRSSLGVTFGGDPEMKKPVSGGEGNPKMNVMEFGSDITGKAEGTGEWKKREKRLFPVM